MANFVASTSAKEEYLVGDYELLKTIAEGGFGKVSLARHIPTGTEVAVKVISQRNLLGIREVLCHRRLNHPNIVQLFEVIFTNHRMFLVMEHVSGRDLEDYLDAHGPMTEGTAKPVFKQLVSAVQYCHQRAIAHRDLKPSNILIDNAFNVKLMDFGLSDTFASYKLSTYCGTFGYMAPEILRWESYDGTKIDMWSLGVTLYRTLLGVLPFMGDTLLQEKKKILSGQFQVPHSISMEGQGLLRQLMTLSPVNRPSLEDIMSHPWLNKGHWEPLKPYAEPPWWDIDPQIMRTMKDMGFEPQDIQESVTERRCNKVMGTYLILTKKRAKMGDSSIMPCSSPDSESGDGSRQQPALRPSSLEASTLTPSSGLEVRVTPPPSLHSGTSTSSPAVQVGPRGPPTPHGHRSTSRGAAPEGPTNEDCPQPGQPDRGTRASPSDPRQGWRGLDRGAFWFLQRFSCCRLCTGKKLFKKTKVIQCNPGERTTGSVEFAAQSPIRRGSCVSAAFRRGEAAPTAVGLPSVKPI